MERCRAERRQSTSHAITGWEIEGEVRLGCVAGGGGGGVGGKGSCIMRVCVCVCVTSASVFPSSLLARHKRSARLACQLRRCLIITGTLRSKGSARMN